MENPPPPLLKNSSLTSGCGYSVVVYMQNANVRSPNAKKLSFIIEQWFTVSPFFLRKARMTEKLVSKFFLTAAIPSNGDPPNVGLVIAKSILEFLHGAMIVSCITPDALVKCVRVTFFTVTGVP